METILPARRAQRLDAGQRRGNGSARSGRFG